MALYFAKILIYENEDRPEELLKIDLADVLIDAGCDVKDISIKKIKNEGGI